MSVGSVMKSQGSPVKGVLFSIEYSRVSENIGLNDIEKVLVTPKPGFIREG